MKVIIDWYNLLRFIFAGEKGHLTKQREYFVKQLGYYKNKKSDITELIVVFDAGPFRHATREIKNGVIIVFSGQKSNADDYIVNYLESHKSNDISVISNDNKLVEKCERVGAVCINCSVFYSLMQKSLYTQEHAQENTSSVQKYENFSREGEEDTSFEKIDSKMYDLMMEQASENIDKKEKDSCKKNIKNESSGNLSRKEKKIWRKLKKL
jgi:predicted RNA-binding protein with PIN domain